jgi:hypothetical protein
MVHIRIKLQVDLQADKSPVVVKGPFFPHVWAQGIESVEQCKGDSNASNLKNTMKTNLIYENRR